MTRMMASAYFIYLFMFRLVAYFAILALMLVITVVALKYLGEWRELRHQQEEEGGSSESSPLMPECKILTTSYGACENDVESADDSSSSANYNSNSKYCSELYDAKICIICYDELRNCFFVPCGHCSTCFSCAQRIFYKENRNCPVCRRFIGKIRRLNS